MTEYCFYAPTGDFIISLLNPKGTATINGETLEQIQERYPRAIKIKTDDIAEHQDRKYVTQPIEITEEIYDNALDILPPLDFQTTVLGQTFKNREMLTGVFTSVYCKIYTYTYFDDKFDARWFVFTDKAFLPHGTIIKKARESEAYQLAQLKQSA